MSDGTQRAVIVGMSGATGLAVVRALASVGVACEAVHFEAAPGMATRLARPHVSPDWRAGPVTFVEYLVRLGEEASRRDTGADDRPDPGSGLALRVR